MGAALTHAALPLVAALLPWSAGYSLLRRASASGAVREALEDEAASNAFRFAVALGAPRDGPDRSAWIRDLRIVQLVDRADLFLSRLRGDRWLDAHVDAAGCWPQRGPFLALTAHWGAGLFALRHLRRAGHRARFLLLRADRRALRGARLAYADARVREVERASGAPVIYTGGAVAEIERTWNAGSPVIALCDAPPTAGRSTIAADAGGVRFRMPAGLVRLACERRMPVVLFCVAVERASGRRRIDIGQAAVHTDMQRMADALAAWLAALIASDTASWHLWPFAAQLLSARAEHAIHIEA